MRAAWWWIDRWQKSTAFKDMTLEEQGAYRNLLDELWLRDGVLPNDERILARLCGDALAWPRVRDAVLKHFRLSAAGWVNDTQAEVQRQSLRRAGNQRNYRQRQKFQLISPLAADNAADNAAGNKAVSPSPVRTERLKNSLSVRPTVPAAAPVKEFLTWFQAEYKRRRHGADYLVKWPRDAPLVKQMLHATSLDRLKLLAQAMLSEKCTEEFIVNTDRGIGILSVKFNWLSDRVAEWETAQHRATMR